MLAVTGLLLSSSAFVCPPPPVEQALKVAGEACGGTCNTYGECAEGLKCMTEKTTSPMSFAILMGGTKKAGVCAKPVLEDRRGLTGMPGGSSAIALDDEGLLSAAKFSMGRIAADSNSLTPPTLSRIVSASKQVVAGIKYTIEVELSDATHRRVEIVDTPWMTPRYNVISHEKI